MPYEDTRVAVEKSQTEIRKMLMGFDVQACRFTSFPSHALLEFVRESEGQHSPYRVTITPKVKGEQTRLAGTPFSTGSIAAQTNIAKHLGRRWFCSIIRVVRPATLSGGLIYGTR